MYIFVLNNPSDLLDIYGLRPLGRTCCEALGRLLKNIDKALENYEQSKKIVLVYDEKKRQYVPMSDQQLEVLYVTYSKEYHGVISAGNEVMNLNCNFPTSVKGPSLSDVNLVSKDGSVVNIIDSSCCDLDTFMFRGGPVDIDWMLRLSFHDFSKNRLFSNTLFYGGKTLWNTTNFAALIFTESAPGDEPEYLPEFGDVVESGWTWPWSDINNAGYKNAPDIASYWLNNNGRLKDIFKPAVKLCECYYGIEIYNY